MTDVDHAIIQPLIAAHAAELRVNYRSLADVGSSNRPAVDWFQKWKWSTEPRDFTAIDVDDEKLKELRTRGIKTANSINDVPVHDLTLALEVIEHIPADASIEFLAGCERITKHLFGLTTPNFEYWDGHRPTSDYKEMRFVPDHLQYLKPGSPNPHHHQQEMTKARLTAYMNAAFPAPKWNVFVYRAWPWLIKDLARDRDFKIYFKLMAIARRAI